MASPENTWRALSDEPMFVDRWQCRIGWHRWSKWSEPIKGAVGAKYSMDYTQNRSCVDCGKFVVREVNTTKA